MLVQINIFKTEMIYWPAHQWRLARAWKFKEGAHADFMLWRRANNYTFTTTTHARRALSCNKNKKKKNLVALGAHSISYQSFTYKRLQSTVLGQHPVLGRGRNGME